MQAITKYRANDGREFKTEAEAITRDTLLRAVDCALSPMVAAPKIREHNYFQHDPKVVIACRVAIQLCAIEFPSFDVFRHEPLEEVHPRSICRNCTKEYNRAYYKKRKASA